jgi:hypothetical protein
MATHSRAGAGPVHMQPGEGDSTSACSACSAGAGAASSRFRLSDGTNTTCSTAPALAHKSVLMSSYPGTGAEQACQPHEPVAL